MGTSGELARTWHAALGGPAGNEADGATAIGTAFGLLGHEAARLIDGTPAGAMTAIRQRARDLVAEGRHCGTTFTWLHGRLPAGRAGRRSTPAAGPARRSPLAPLALAARVLLRRP
jgi:hypothetical protein